MIAIPQHREAFPALNVREAIAAAAAGRPVCNYTNQSGLLVGQAFFVRRFRGDSDDRLLFGYSFFGDHHRATSNSVVLAYEPVLNGLGRERIYTRCSGCKGRREIVVFKGRWACGGCHRLSYRSQVIPHDVKLWERIRQLEAIVGKGRPHRMRHEMFYALQEELTSLKQQSGKPRKWASLQHSYRVNREWNSPATEGFQLQNSQYVVHKGQIVHQSIGTGHNGTGSAELDQADAVAPSRTPEQPRQVRLDPRAIDNDSLYGPSYWRDEGQA